MKRIGLILIAILLVAFPLFAQAQYVSIPDNAFLIALVEKGVDTDGDGLISRAEAEMVTNLDVSQELLGCGSQAGPCPIPISAGSICSLVGIEHFTNLDSLDCSGNHIDNIDLLYNVNLKFINCSGNGAHYGGGLRELNIQNCKSLTYLDCSWTQMSFLDISKNNYLQKIVMEGYYADDWCTPGEIALNVWDTFSEDSIKIDSVFEFNSIYLGGPWERYYTSNIKYTFSKVPQIYIDEELSYSENIELSCSEYGKIYLVPEGTRATTIEIRKAGIDSIEVRKDENIVFSLSLSTFPSGQHWLYAVSEDHIVSKSVEFSYIAVGINKRSISDLYIFPNPTQNYLTIETNQSGRYIIEFTSINGQEIYSGEIEGNSHQLNLSSFQKGVYFITIRSKGFVTTRKIIKL